MINWGNSLPWSALLVVPLVLGVTDDSSLGDVAEVVFTLAVDGSVSLAIASNSGGTQTIGVCLLKTRPADSSVSEGSGDRGNFGRVGMPGEESSSGLIGLRFAGVDLIVIVVRVLGRDPPGQNPGE